MIKLQPGVETQWAKAVRNIIRATDSRQAQLVDLTGLPQPTLNLYLNEKRHPPIDAVHLINSAMGKLLQNQSVTEYLESLIADSISGKKPLDCNVSAATDGGFMRGLDLIHSYLRADAYAEIMQSWRNVGAPAGLFHDVNRAWRREIIRSIDGSVPQKLFVDEMIAIFRKHGIELQDYFKPLSEVAKYRDLGQVVRVIRIALARTGAPVSLRNELESSIIPAVLNLVHKRHDYDRLAPVSRGSKN